QSWFAGARPAGAVVLFDTRRSPLAGGVNPPPVVAVMTPPVQVIVVPSHLTAPNAEDVASGSRAAARVPEPMFVALVVSVVADAAKATPFVFVTVSAPVPVFSVPSPPTVKPPNAPA